MTEAESPNTKHVSVTYPVPRDPEAYRATTHFGQRLRERVPERDQDVVIRRCIEHGRCRGTRPVESVEETDAKQYFAFEETIRDRRYRLVVGVREVAFKQPDRRHLAVTIMEVTDD